MSEYDIKVGQWYECNRVESDDLAYGVITAICGVFADYEGYDKEGNPTSGAPYKVQMEYFLIGWTLCHQPLCTMTLEDYNSKMESGKFFMYYPEATGNYCTDTGKNLEDSIPTTTEPFVTEGVRSEEVLPNVIEYDDNEVTATEYIRKNDGKADMKYWMMFPHAAKAVCERLTENEDKYPNDRFCEYVPEETVASLLRHLIDLSAPYPVFNLEESKEDHMKAVLFGAMCLIESVTVQGHDWSK